MRTGPRLLLLFPLAALLACGSSPSGSLSTTPSTPAYNFNGTWKAVATSNYPEDLAISSMGGTLQVSNGTVTGTLYAYSDGDPSYNPYICSAINTPLTVTGTLDSNHNLALTFPIAGGTGTLVAPLGNNPATYTYGSWTVAGGACAMSQTSMAIQQTAPTTPPVVSAPSPITASLSGNWGGGIIFNPNNFETVFSNFGTQTIYVTPPVTGFSGPLQFSNGSVTGTLHLSFGNTYGVACQSFNGSSAVFTGTLDANNNLTLTAPITGVSSNGTATITATLGSNPQTLADASFQIVGASPCTMSATPSTIAQYAPVTGTYTGAFNSPYTGNVPFPGTNITVTAALTQSTTANSSGQFPITGTVTVTGNCAETATLATGTVSGGEIYSASVTGNIVTGPLFEGGINPTASTILWAEFADYSTGSQCTADYYGTLTRQ